MLAPIRTLSQTIRYIRLRLNRAKIINLRLGLGNDEHAEKVYLVLTAKETEDLISHFEERANWLIEEPK